MLDAPTWTMWRQVGHMAELTRWKLEIPPVGVWGTFEKQRSPEMSSTQASLLPGLRSGRWPHLN